MDEFSSLGKLLMLLGVVIFSVGGFIMLSGKIPFIGKLPGDIYIDKGNFSFYFPLTTGIILSIILTILVNLFIRR